MAIIYAEVVTAELHYRKQVVEVNTDDLEFPSQAALIEACVAGSVPTASDNLEFSHILSDKEHPQTVTFFAESACWNTAPNPFTENL